MKKYLLICCLAFASACTHNSDSSTPQLTAPPSVDTEAEGLPATADPAAAADAPVSTASYFKIEGSLKIRHSKSSSQDSDEHGLGPNDVIVKDGKVFSSDDLEAMQDSQVVRILSNSCLIKTYFDGDDSERLLTLELSSEFHFLSIEWSVDLPSENATNKTYPADGLYQAKDPQQPMINCYFKTEAKSLGELASTESIEAVVRRNFGDLVTITTIK